MAMLTKCVEKMILLQPPLNNLRFEGAFSLSKESIKRGVVSVIIYFLGEGDCIRYGKASLICLFK